MDGRPAPATTRRELSTPASDPACAGRPWQGRPSFPWVESSRDPWNVPVKVRQTLSVLFPTLTGGRAANTVRTDET